MHRRGSSSYGGLRACVGGVKIGGMKGEQIDKIDRLSVRSRPQGWPLMYQSWDKLLFMHWPMPVEALRPLIPDLLTIDTFEGTAWMGVTPFTMWGIRPVFSPSLPALSRSHELNVRTYVYVDGIPGVWFLSLDANNPLAVLGARLAFHLPYFTANMSLESETRPLTSLRGAPKCVLHALSSRRFGRSERGWDKLSRVRLTFSSPSGTVSTPLAEADSTALASSTALGLCAQHACCRFARR